MADKLETEWVVLTLNMKAQQHKVGFFPPKILLANYGD